MAELYDTTRFETLWQASWSPQVENLALAAIHLTRLIESHGIPTALMGGFAVFLRGSGRATNDIDVVVGCTMDRLLEILHRDPRLYIPIRHGATAITVFVGTGGALNPGFEQKNVYSDIVINGHLGTPADLPNGTEEISTVLGQLGVARVLDVFHQIQTKLYAFCARQTTHDYLDLTFLIIYNREYVHERHHLFPVEQRENFARRYAVDNDEEVVALMRWTLGLQ